ncbi:MAG: MFS transporter, partial [Flavobacteriales bacterium]
FIFWWGTSHYKHADVIKPAAPTDMSLTRIFSLVLLPALLFGLVPLSFENPLVGSTTTDCFLFGCIPVLFFYGRLWLKSPTEERQPIGAMLAIFMVVIAFWAVFKQNGSTLNTWANNYTDRKVPTAIQPAASALKLAEKIDYVKDSTAPTDHQFRKLDKEKIVAYPDYFKNSKLENIPKEGESIYAFNTNLFQSVNPFWVIVLTPLVVAFFTFLRSRKKEPSTPTKIAFGLLISALSCLVMVGAVYASQNGAEKSSPWWFISSYAVITIGELFLSPMGLSLVSKLSPPRLTALMMGGWFLATSIGNKLSGVLSSLWDSYENKADFFYVNAILLGLAALALFVLLKRLNKVFSAYK